MLLFGLKSQHNGRKLRHFIHLHLCQRLIQTKQNCKHFLSAERKNRIRIKCEHNTNVLSYSRVPIFLLAASSIFCVFSPFGRRTFLQRLPLCLLNEGSHGEKNRYQAALFLSYSPLFFSLDLVKLPLASLMESVRAHTCTLNTHTRTHAQHTKWCLALSELLE